MNIIETKELCYTYEDGTIALNSVSLNIEKGKTTGIIGGNGSGKSTLFLNLNGVLKPGGGSIIIEGAPIGYNKKELFSLKQKVGIVFQNSEEQLFSANVKNDISFGLRNMGLSEGEVNSRVKDVAQKTGVTEILGKPTHALSFGQKKRVAIAGVLAMKPSVIILDEPTAGLDPQGVSEILRLVELMKKEEGVTVIFSTHEIDLIPLYCNFVYVLDRGEVVFSGSPTKLWESPDILRKHNLRLPRIAHLMEVLRDKDGIYVDKSAATISRARETVRGLLERES